MRKLVNRIVCVFTFVTDIPILLLTMIYVTVIGFIAIMFGKMSFNEFWNEVKDTGSIDRLKILYVKLWRSFRDGELYS